MTRKDVIRAIVKRDIQKQPLSARCIRKEFPELYRAAGEHFGNWETALQYAGISRRRIVIQTQYDRQWVCDEIHRLCAKGCLLFKSQSQKRNYILYTAACRYFGTWRDALLAAGVNPDNLLPPRKSPKPDQETILECIRNRHREGHILDWRMVCRENQQMAHMAKRYFKTWEKAMIAAGVQAEPSVPHKRVKKTNTEDSKSAW